MLEVIKDGQTGFLVNNIDEAVDKLKAISGLDRSECRSWVQERLVKSVWSPIIYRFTIQ